MGRTIPVDVLTRFTRTLVGHYDIGEILWEFTDTVTDVLDTAGAGVSLADGEELRFITATSEAVRAVEQVQQEAKQGPCHAAYRHGEPWTVTDFEMEGQWPDYRGVALDVGLRSMVGVPMIYQGKPIGALNVYDTGTREWTVDDVDVCRVLGDMATSYVARKAELASAQELSEQLQRALDSRVIIEQAKGILSGHHGVSLHEAFERMRNHARSNNVSLKSVATAIVERGFRLGTDKA